MPNWLSRNQNDTPEQAAEAEEAGTEAGERVSRWGRVTNALEGTGHVAAANNVRGRGTADSPEELAAAQGRYPAGPGRDGNERS